MLTNTSGTNNTAVGRDSMYSNTTGSENVALGLNSLVANTTGANNTAIGRDALQANTIASNNIAVGYQAAYSTTGNNNTCIGYQAGYTNTTSEWNTFVGRSAGNLSTGYGNTFIGCNGGGGGGAGNAMTTGVANVIIGGYSGNQGGLDIRTATGYIVLSEGNGNYSAYGTSGAWYKGNNTTTWSTVSDRRIKQNIVPLENALNKIIALNPVEFDYILNGKHDVSFIAQEYKNVFPEQVREENAISDEIKSLTSGEPLLTLDTNLVPYLVKSIQEQQTIINDLKARVTALEGAA
jgi:hypothetical protein